MTAQYKQPISVLVVVFYERDGSYEVLLLEKKDFPGFWQSVTGSREDKEEIRDTAIRELKEETGLDLSLGALRDWHIENTYEIYPEWQHRYAPGITRNHEHVFGFQLMKKATIKISPEHRDYQWMDWQHAAARVFSPSNRQAILLLPEYSHGY